MHPGAVVIDRLDAIGKRVVLLSRQAEVGSGEIAKDRHDAFGGARVW